MNNTKLSFIALAILVAICGCNNDDAMNTSSEYINSVRVSVDDFIPEASTRTAYTVDNTGFHFTWTDGDALGIYPVGGDQVKFPISGGDGSASASFDGGAWKLRSTYQYAAYYPFSTANYTFAQTALPVDFTGQTQDGNSSTAHLSAYDYLACAATTPDVSGGVDLTMKHLGAFIRLQLTMPKADTYSSIELKSDGTEFVTAGTFDLTTATPAITSTATSSTFTINLNNISTTAANEVLTIYAILAPSNLSTSNITVTVHGTGLTTYAQTVTGKNFEARKAYNIAVTSFSSTGTNGHDWVDLGLSVKWATCNIGAENPEDYGDYFAWGETTGYNSGKTNFSWSTYKWCNGSGITLTKYCINSSYGTVDNRTVLESSDDAATANWGGSWRMPTHTEWYELYNECTWTSSVLNGINGYIVTSKKNGYTESIFLPAAGYHNDTEFFITGSDGNYWSSSLGTYNTGAWGFGFFSDRFYPDADFSLYLGLSIRPVCTE